MDKYAKQDRGELSDYEKYFAGMDSSMQQKIALTTAHFPSRGRVADMGSGSGSGTFDLARLYRELELIGVDINPKTVEYSNNHYKSENLKFTVGDIAENVFPANSLDGILDSSVLHHVTSFNGFDVSQISKTIANQVAQLRLGGVLIIRDFVIPDDAEKTIFIDLPNDDGIDDGEIPQLSTSALFKVFARDFRSCVNMDSAVSYKSCESSRSNFDRFEATLKTAAEFVLRKDYRDHWAPELLEEYTYYSQKDFEENFRRENLRIVVSMPLWNPWIVENRFAGKFFLSDFEGNSVNFPPTNYLIAGEKVSENDGVLLSENRALAHARASASGSALADARASASGNALANAWASASGIEDSALADVRASASENDGRSPRVSKGVETFLNLKAYRHKETGQIFELVERPNQTIDLLPWFEGENGQLFVLAKKDFPRLIINANAENKHLHRANYSGYLTEPINAILSEPPASAGGLKTDIENVLSKRANLDPEEILEITDPSFYFTSPGGIDEQVISSLVNIKPLNREPQEIENYTKFKSAGTVRELDALQVLRASHVGGMFDARLEINIYRLLKELKRSASSWIGAAIKPSIQTLPDDFAIADDSIFSSANRQMFDPGEISECKFLNVVKAEFIETDSKNNEISNAEFEYVIPKSFSKNTVAAIPFFKTEKDMFVGVELRDLPAPQNYTGNSQIVCVPAWRLPNEIEHKFDIESFLKARFPIDFNVSIIKIWELGGTYFPTPGVTPEIVFPMAIELKVSSAIKTELKFFPMFELLAKLKNINDAHLLILANRLGHALGFLSE